MGVEGRLVPDRAWREGGDRRRDRRREDDHRESPDPVLRLPEGGDSRGRRGHPRRGRKGPPPSDRARAPGRLSLLGDRTREHRVRRPRADRRRGRSCASGSGWREARLTPPARPGGGSRGARRLFLHGRAADPRFRPRAPLRPEHPDPGRGDLERRRRDGAHDPGRAEAAFGRTHVACDRPPLEHDPRRRSNPRDAQRRAARAGDARRAPSQGRDLRAPPRASVREAARGGADVRLAAARTFTVARTFAVALAISAPLLPGSPSSGLAASFGAETYEPHKESAIAGTPFTRYFTTDRFRREITFYLSDAPDSVGALPLIVYIQGSGGNSNFAERGGRIVTQ